jgi:hypothetical protein
MTSYAIARWEEEKDFEWFAKIGTEIGVGILLNYFGAKFQANQDTGFFSKIWKSYIFQAGSDVVITPVWDQLFGMKESDVEKRIEELKLAPDFEERVKKLYRFLDESKVFDQVSDKFKEYFSNESNSESINLDTITPEDLDSEEVREMILELMAKELYEEESGELIVTGNQMIDRYAFYRAYSVMTVPRGIVVSLAIFRVLCTSVNPVQGVASAVGILLADRLIMRPIDYKVREWAINQ